MRAFFKKYGHLIVILAGILLTVGFFIILYSDFASIGTDGVAYALLGQSIAQGHGLTIYGVAHTVFSPLLPVVIALIFLVSHSLEFATVGSSFIAGLISIPLFYLLCRKIASSTVALIGLIFFVFDSNFIFSYLGPSPQILVMLLSIILFLILLGFIKPPSKNIYFWIFRALGVGVLCGLMYLARPEYFFFIIPVIIALLLIMPRAVRMRWRIFAAIICLLGFIIVSTPYLFFLHRHTGGWTFTGRSSAIGLFVTGQLDENVQGDNFLEPSTSQSVDSGGVIGSLFRHPATAAKKLFKGLRDAQRNFSQVLGLLIIGLVALGIRDFILKRKFKELLIIVIFLTPLIAVAIGQGGTANYLVQFYFIFLILAAVGSVSLLEDINRILNLSKTLRIVLGIVLIGGTAASLFITVPQNILFTPPDSLRKEFKQMGVWIRENHPEAKDQPMLTRKPATAFYAGAQFVDLPLKKSIRELIDFMRSKKIKYLTIDQRYVLTESPQLADLIDPSKTPRDLELIHSIDYLGHGIYFYRLR